MGKGYAQHSGVEGGPPVFLRPMGHLCLPRGVMSFQTSEKLDKLERAREQSFLQGERRDAF